MIVIICCYICCYNFNVFAILLSLVMNKVVYIYIYIYIYIDYSCAKFGDFSFSRFGFIVRTDRQTDRLKEENDRYTQYTRDYRRREL